jgi:hypothetical protein
MENNTTAEINRTPLVDSRFPLIICAIGGGRHAATGLTERASSLPTPHPRDKIQLAVILNLAANEAHTDISQHTKQLTADAFSTSVSSQRTRCL